VALPSPRIYRQRPRFRVIEGGASRQSERNPRRAAHHVHALTATLLLVALVVVMLFLNAVADRMVQRRVDDALADTTVENVVVMPGDTLWDIADRHPVPGCTTQELVRVIRDINDIDDANLSIGMCIDVPVPA
jgi:hypothetical protein